MLERIPKSLTRVYLALRKGPMLANFGERHCNAAPEGCFGYGDFIPGS
jgi:hypothetical protein